MKICILPAIGTLLFTGTPIGAAEFKTATPVKIKANQIHEEPFRFNGAVLTDVGRGSGFCAWNRHTFFTAAHVVFGETSWEAPPLWYPAANSAELDLDKGIQSRGYYRWTEYGDLASAEFPDKSPFSQDVVLAYAFKKLIPGTPATLNLNGSKDLRKKIRTMITGYPAVKAYTDTDIAGYFLHKTGPTVTPYESYEGQALITTLVSSGGGNSGGPVWSKNARGKWTASGVLVGGLPSESLVYAFSKDTNSLIRAVTPVIRPEIDPPVSVSRVSSSSVFFPYNRPQRIPDGEHKWTSFRIRVGGFEDTALVTAVRLSLDIRTKHRGDLQVLLEGPGGYYAVVHNEQGANRNNLILKDAEFSSAFTDIVANGNWYVRVQDRLTGDVATLKSIVLEIATDDSSATPTP